MMGKANPRTPEAEELDEFGHLCAKVWQGIFQMRSKCVPNEPQTSAYGVGPDVDSLPRVLAGIPLPVSLARRKRLLTHAILNNGLRVWRIPKGGSAMGVRENLRRVFLGLILTALEGACLLAAPGMATGAEVLRVVSDDNYPPYLFRNEDGSVSGYLVDYWQLWEKKTGVRVELRAMNWAEAQRQVLSGDAEVIDMIFRTPTREPLYDFSPAYADLPVGIYSDVSINGLTDAASLKGFQIGVQAGDACIDELGKSGIRDLVQFPNYAALITAAQAQEIRIFCLDQRPADFYLYKFKAEKQFRKSFTLYTGRFHRAVRKGNLATLQMVEQGMVAVSAAEEQQLTEKWFGTPVQFERYARALIIGALALFGLGILLFFWNLTLRRRVAASTANLQQTLGMLEQTAQAEVEVKARLSATLQAIPDLLFELDRDGRYLDIYANPGSPLFDQRENLIGRPVQDVLPAAAAQTAKEALEAAFQTGSDYGRSIQLPVQGQTCWFELSVTRKGEGESASCLMLSRDITARRQAEQALLQARLQGEREQMFRTMFDAMPVAVLFLQEERIAFVNRRFSELFGYEKSEIGKTEDWWPIAYPDPDYRQEVMSLWEKAKSDARQADGRVRALEYRVMSKKGEVHELLIGGQFLDADSLLVTFTEITAIKQAEQLLRQAHDAAQASSSAKTAFLANMSHEIRTPLNAIIGLSHMIAKSIQDPLQLERIGKVIASGQHLLGIISDILDLSKIEAGKFVLENAPLRVQTVVHNVISMLTERAQEKGLRLESELDELPDDLLGDAIRLQQALLNYGTNAVKFTGRGSIVLRVDVMEHNAGDCLLRFSVRDTGVGINVDDIPRLFDAFEQGDNSTTRNFGGTGLGLAITRKIAELMGGTAGAESTPGYGSFFWFTARLEKGAHPAATPSCRPAGEAEQLLRRNYAGLRVLVVEDEPINREIATIMLEEVCIVVDTACDGAQAVERASGFAYPLILMDMQMPLMDGLAATRAIRQLPGYAHIPILAMTANAFREDKERCMEAGMSGLLTKPITPNDLYASLLNALGGDPEAS